MECLKKIPFLDSIWVMKVRCNHLDTLLMMYIIKQTEMFTKWLRKLRDLRARIAIARRIERAQKGNLGDHRSIGKNLFEMRMTIGPGYRI